MASSLVEAAAPLLELPRPSSVTSVDSEYECELMIEALRRELSAVRSQLAFLTHNLDVSSPSLPGRQQEVSQVEPAASPPPITLAPTHRSRQRQPVAKKVVRAERVEPAAAVTAAAVDKMKDVGRYLAVVDQAEGERWELRKRCLQLMQRHIEQQLVCLKERGEQLRKRLARRQKKAKTELLKLKPPRYRSPGKDDTTFLKNVYQSTFYQIIGVEHQLRKTGKLRSLMEVKEFWDFMLSPLQPPTLAPPTTDQGPRPLLREEDADEETSNSWAITATPPDPAHRRKSPSVRMCLPPTPLTASSNSDPLKFIPGKLPEIKPIAHIFNEGRPEPDEEKRGCEHVFRVQELAGERKRLRNMYQQARANEMAMRRLLPQLPTFEHSSIPNDVMMTSPPPDDVMMTSSTTAPEVRGVEPVRSHVGLRGGEQQEGTPRTHSVDELTARRSSLDEVARSSSLDQSLQASDDVDTSVVVPPLPIPLTMESAATQQSTVILEPKGKSALWSNYLMVRR